MAMAFSGNTYALIRNKMQRSIVIRKMGLQVKVKYDGMQMIIQVPQP